MLQSDAIGNNHFHKHELIAGPSGLSGYIPREWCAVCGKSSGKTAIFKCSDDNCPNICHKSCLDVRDFFDCFDVQELRNKLDIHHPVVYVDLDDDSLEESEDNYEDDLNQLSNQELIITIQNLRKELGKKSTALSFFDSFIRDLTKQREALVTALDFIDNLASYKSTLEELDFRSIASTARPEKIDEEWERKINSDQNSMSWWSSDKPKKLKNLDQNNENNNGKTVPNEDTQQRIIPTHNQENIHQPNKKNLNLNKGKKVNRQPFIPRNNKTVRGRSNSNSNNNNTNLPPTRPSQYNIKFRNTSNQPSFL